MIMAILGILDIIAGATLVFVSPAYAGNSYLFYLVAILFLKAIYSIGTAVAAGFYFDLLGYLDLLSAVCTLLLLWGISFGGFFFWVGILMVMKGVYSSLMAFISN